MRNELRKKLVEEYEEKEQLYKEFASLVRNMLEVLLTSKGFKFQIFHRPKDKDKVAGKIDRKRREGKEYTKLNDMEDLAGARVVFYLESDKVRWSPNFGQVVKSGFCS